MTYIRFMEDKIVTKPPITKSVCVLWPGGSGAKMLQVMSLVLALSLCGTKIPAPLPSSWLTAQQAHSGRPTSVLFLIHGKDDCFGAHSCLVLIPCSLSITAVTLQQRKYWV